MLQQVLTALTSRAAIGIAAGTLALGAAATAAPVLIGDSRDDTEVRGAATEEESTTLDATSPVLEDTAAARATATRDHADGADARAAARCADDDERSNPGLDSHDNEAWDDDGDKHCADGTTTRAADVESDEHDDADRGDERADRRGGRHAHAVERDEEHGEDDDDAQGSNRGGRDRGRGRSDEVDRRERD